MKVRAFGHVSTESVSDVLARVRELLGGDSVAVVRSIDSTRAEADLSRILSFHAVPHQVVVGNVQLKMEGLMKALVVGAFTGFDEVWIFSGDSPILSLGDVPSATSDASDFSDGVPEELAARIESTDCILVVGDGCGLNYATSDDRIGHGIATVEH